MSGCFVASAFFYPQLAERVMRCYVCRAMGQKRKFLYKIGVAQKFTIQYIAMGQKWYIPVTYFSEGLSTENEGLSTNNVDNWGQNRTFWCKTCVWKICGKTTSVTKGHQAQRVFCLRNRESRRVGERGFDYSQSWQAERCANMRNKKAAFHMECRLSVCHY